MGTSATRGVMMAPLRDEGGESFGGRREPSRVAAFRYLTFLATRGWLERVSDTGLPKYVLGPKALQLAPGDFLL